MQSQAECDDLADRLEVFLDNYPEDSLSVDAILSPEGHVVMEPCEDIESSYAITRDRLEEFTTFLRCCGGFEIC